MNLRTARVRRSFAAAKVSLVVYDILEREVVTLVNGTVEAGIHTVMWNAGTAATGVYYAVFTAHDGMGILRCRTARKLVVIR